jgi:hypothetical protein
MLDDATRSQKETSAGRMEPDRTIKLFEKIASAIGYNIAASATLSGRVGAASPTQLCETFATSSSDLWQQRFECVHF